MGKEFLPLFLDFNETTQDLNDEQCGRLVRALVDYANGREREISGMELLAFRFLKGSIDRNEKLSAIRSKAGLKGGRPKSNENQMKANESKTNQMKANESKEKQNAINNNNDIIINTDINSKAFLDEAEATGILLDHNRVIDAAEDAGFKMGNTVRAALIQLYAEHGLDKMLNGIRECVTHGAPNLAYLGAVLKGKSKAKAPLKVLPAQQYEQRDYSGVNDELSAQQDKEMEEWLKAGGNDQ